MTRDRDFGRIEVPVSQLSLVCGVGELGVEGAISVPAGTACSAVAQDELQVQSNTAACASILGFKSLWFHLFKL